MHQNVYTVNDPFPVYGWARYQPMREVATSITSSLVGWDLAQPYVEYELRWGCVSSHTAEYGVKLMKICCSLLISLQYDMFSESL